SRRFLAPVGCPAGELDRPGRWPPLIPRGCATPPAAARAAPSDPFSGKGQKGLLFVVLAVPEKRAGRLPVDGDHLDDGPFEGLGRRRADRSIRLHVGHLTGHETAPGIISRLPTAKRALRGTFEKAPRRGVAPIAAARCRYPQGRVGRAKRAAC